MNTFDKKESTKNEMKNVVPVVFATDDNYFPYMAVSIQSVMENADSKQNFKIYVLGQVLSSEYKQLLQKQIDLFENFEIEYVDAAKYFEGYTIKNLKYTINTYFRLVIPYILTAYKYAIWLDADAICLTNIGDLCDNTDERCMLKAVKDVGVLAILRNHSKNMVVIDYKKYFNAGVLLFNIEKFKESVSFDEIMKLESENDFPYGDQELLNVVSEDKVQFISMNWNAMCFKCKPYNAPKIVHYVWDKPWRSFFPTNRSKYFWEYAKKTPFYNIILDKSKEKEWKDLVSIAKCLIVSIVANFRVKRDQ